MKPDNKTHGNENGARKQSPLSSALSSQWKSIWFIFDVSQRAFLGKYIAHLSNMGVAPENANQAHFDAFAIARLTGLTGKAFYRERDQLNSAVTKWSEIAPILQLCPLERIKTERAARKAEKENLPPLILQQIAEFEDWAKIECPGAYVPKRNRLYDAVAIARAIGIELESFRTIDDEFLESFVTAPVFGPIDQVSTRRNRIFGELEALAREVLKDTELAESISSTRALCAKVGLEITERSVDRLTAFDDPNAMTQLLRMCDKALAEFERHPSKQLLAVAQAAVAIPLLNNLAAKRSDLLSFAFNGPVRQNAAVSRPALMATIYGQLENIDLLVEDPVGAIIDRYYVAASQIGFGEGPLFVTAQNGLKSPEALTTSITRLAARGGFQLSAQLLRDLAVKRMIEHVEKHGSAIGDDTLKDAIGYGHTTNFTFRYDVFRTRLVSAHLLE
jgi:hypothetical protein